VLASCQREIAQLEAAVDARRAAAGILHRSAPAAAASALAMVELGDLVWFKGYFDEAEAILTRALMDAPNHLDDDGVPVRARVLNALGIVYKDLGRYDAAEAAYAQAFSPVTSTDAGDDSTVASLWHNIAGLAHARGDTEQAATAAAIALQHRERAFGAAHHLVAEDLAVQGAALFDLGMTTDAEQLFTRALRIFRARHPADHYDVAVNISNLAACRLHCNDAAGAETLFRQGSVRVYFPNADACRLGISEPRRRFGSVASSNPSRQIEQIALRIVRSYVGDRGTITDQSHTGLPDFRIDYADRRVAIGEITWHADRILQAMYVEAIKNDRLVPLRPGLGSWTAMMRRGALVPRVHAELPDLIADLDAAGLDQLEVYADWPRGQLADHARRLGIEWVHRVSVGRRDMAMYSEPMPGGAVPEDPDVIVDWLEGVVADPDYADLTGKLRDVEADERHIFVMTGAATMFGVDDLFRQLHEHLPRRAPLLPLFITHAWAASWWGTVRSVALWTRKMGWSAVPVPPLNDWPLASTFTTARIALGRVLDSGHPLDVREKVIPRAG
jgi:hypothetical protein